MDGTPVSSAPETRQRFTARLNPLTILSAVVEHMELSTDAMNRELQLMEEAKQGYMRDLIALETVRDHAATEVKTHLDESVRALQADYLSKIAKSKEESERIKRDLDKDLEQWAEVNAFLSGRRPDCPSPVRPGVVNIFDLLGKQNPIEWTEGRNTRYEEVLALCS